MQYGETDMSEGTFSEYVAAVAGDAVHAHAAVLLLPYELDDEHPAGIAVKMHVQSDIPPDVIVGVLRQCADELERQKSS